MKNTARTALAAALLGALVLQGCASHSTSPDVYSASQSQREQMVRMATVESVRAVEIKENNGQPSGLGAIGGGAVGAVAGSTIGGGRGSLLTGIIGGLAGAVAGNSIENHTANRKGLELTVRLDNGDYRAITQEATGEVFHAGDRVRLLSSAGVTRVTH